MIEDQEEPNVNVDADMANVGAKAMHLLGLDNPGTGVENGTSEREIIDALLMDSEVIAKNSDVLPINEAGYVIRLHDQEAVQGNDWVMFDLDDTLIAYTGAKKQRHNNFMEYATKKGLSISAEQGETILNATDNFSRWNENGEVMYHLDAHKSALSWAISELKGVQLDEVPSALDRIETQLLETNDPSEKQELLSNSTVERENLDEVFSAMLQPPAYEDIAETMLELAGGDNLSRVNIGVFTYGEPSFQLQKILLLMEDFTTRGIRLPISHIWLTKVSKGQFMSEVVETMGSKGVKNELFDDSPHTILLVDDSPKELDSFAVTKKTIYEKTKTYLARLRMIRQNTKNESSSWGKKGDSNYGYPATGFHDETAGASRSLSATVYNYLANNLTLVAKKRSEESVGLDDKTIDRLNTRLSFYSKKAMQGSPSILYTTHLSKTG